MRILCSCGVVSPSHKDLPRISAYGCATQLPLNVSAACRWYRLHWRWRSMPDRVWCFRRSLQSSYRPSQWRGLHAPYLVKADRTPATRPVINSLSSNSAVNGFSVRPGGTLNVEMYDGTGVTFALLRIDSATHSVNSDQRRIALTNVVANGNQFTITIPTDSGVLTPGPYFLFALSKNKVPSMARTARVTR